MKTPESVVRFLQGKRIAVAGVSRKGDVAANAIFKKLQESGYEAIPINPNTDTVEEVRCYPDIASIPGELDGVVIATHPGVSALIVRQCKERGVPRVWLHRSFGSGSVSDEAVRECERLGIECIVGGCPLMFCEPVDVGHKCMRWWLQRRGRVAALLVLSTAIVMSIVLSTPAYPHCDGMDGPVIKAAKAALTGGDVSPVLIWVRQSDEAEIRRAFEHTVNVRNLSQQAKELADTYFFETVVRVHREGEGAPYTGLKPAGVDLGPAIPAADRSLVAGDVTPLMNLLVEEVRAGLLERYERARASSAFEARDVDAGREYVEAYVAYIHYVEGMHAAAAGEASSHHPEGTPDPHGGK